MDADVRARLEAAVLRGIDKTDGPMRWGVDDCALWCADILKDALGYDAAVPWRTGYTDRDGAERSLGHLGLCFALKRAARMHGWRKISPDQACAGDIGIALLPALINGEVKLRPTTMICRAPGWFVARSVRGYAALRTEFANVRVAWAVV